MERDTVIFDLIAKERQRQQEGIELIASENFVSDEVMEAMGSCLTNKYAEGYPVARLWTKPSNSPSTAPANFLVLNTPTCNRTPAHKPTLLYSSPA